MGYKIFPVKMGNSKALFDFSIFMKGHPIGTENFHMPFSFFVIKNDETGEVYLADAGCSTNEENLIQGREELLNEVSFEDGLASCGVKPEDVTKVFLTHLHWDHSWNVDKLPNAEFYVQRKEMHHAIDPLPHERRPFCFTGIKGFEQPKWPKVIDRIKIVDGDVEVVPGITLVLTPGHTHGSQTVLVHTDKGNYAITGDFCYVKRNWTECVPINKLASFDEWYDAYNRLKTYEVTDVLPTHDPSTFLSKVYG